MMTRDDCDRLIAILRAYCHGRRLWDVDEFVGIGLVAACEAMARYDETRGAARLSWAVYRGRLAIFDECRRRARHAARAAPSCVSHVDDVEDTVCVMRALERRRIEIDRVLSDPSKFARYRAGRRLVDAVREEMSP